MLITAIVIMVLCASFNVGAIIFSIKINFWQTIKKPNPCLYCWSFWASLFEVELIFLSMSAVSHQPMNVEFYIQLLLAPLLAMASAGLGQFLGKDLY